MSEAERTGLDHVVLPRRRPGLALLERHRPSPADNVLDAELSAFAAPGDTVLDPWAGTGSVARRAVGHGMRAVAADASPFSQLAAIALLNAPDASVLDAAFAQLAGSRRVDVPLKQHIEELYASRCADLSTADRRRPVHLAPRRRRAGSQDLPLRLVRCVDRRPRGACRARGRGGSRQARHRARRARAGADRGRGRGAAARADRPDRDRRGTRRGRGSARRGRRSARAAIAGRSTRRAALASGLASPPPSDPTRSRSARPRASVTARSTSSCEPASPSSTAGTSSSPSCSTSTPRATCMRSTPSARRSTASCATLEARPRCAWRSLRACCRPAG